MTVNRCTFEPCGGEIFSVGQFKAGWVKNDRTSRGVENLLITENDFQGTGVTVNGFAPVYTKGLEFADTYPTGGTGASEFSRNRIGRCGSSWFNFSWSAADGMTFADNLFDANYKPGGIDPSPDEPSQGGISDSTFHGNTYVFAAGGNRPYRIGGVMSFGDGNTFEDETWIKTGDGGFGGGIDFPFTNSTYTDCHFHLPASATFPAGSVGSGCDFDNGHTGGTFR